MNKVNTIKNYWESYLKKTEFSWRRRRKINEVNNIINIWESYIKNRFDEDYLTMYIHFPYCLQKCSYCMYRTHAVGKEDYVKEFLDTVEAQFMIASQTFKNESIKALYIGGGSPSLMSANDMETLFDLISEYWNAEFSDDNMFNIELHSSQITDDKLKAIENSFINRISIGIQSLDEDVLRANKRIYITKNIIHENISKILAFNKNLRLNVDLMYGLAGQSDESFISDVNEFVKMNVSSITMYGYRNTPNNNNRRTISDDNTFMRNLINVMDKIRNQENYGFLGSSNGIYNEWNVLINKSMKKFKYEYDPVPRYFNNIVSFGPHLGHKSMFQSIRTLIEFNENGTFIQEIPKEIIEYSERINELDGAELK
ncbi:MAG: radical SAM protein [Victivallales bacterium]|jgi:coproporphyrinogen III oxidase-like Fe-S oxidoreductase